MQGVGFRPFIYRLALSYNLNGTVENRNDGVIILVNTSQDILKRFIEDIRLSAPLASHIEIIEYEAVKPFDFKSFSIVKSSSVSEQITDVSPDIAVCDECLADMKMQANRIDYPFINCTNCGPRFTIIEDLPYDREKTTMSPFEMCPACRKEYTNIQDRRFHAQPVACSDCGPEYTLYNDGQKIKEIQTIIKELCKLFNNHKIVAIKGLGGYFLACDASDEEAVSKLRTRKNREGKPFAVMFSSLDAIKEFAYFNDTESSSLTSFRRPIVLLNQKRQLAPSVTLGFNTIGAMLPYMPLHHLLFENLKMKPLVLTSGNISEEPIIIDNEQALSKLTPVADAVLTYNRAIYNRADDSVTLVVNDKERLIRRSRGYVPVPLNLKFNVDGILAVGAELVNCFCIGKENQAILSQHIGDLKNLETYGFYTETINQFKKLFRFKPSVVVSDLHPDYLSTRFAEELKLKHIKVQHHHAHIASCMAEYNLDEKVIGVSFDGTGYGDDGNIWGGEFFVCDLLDYERVNHFEYIPMPGGDKVTDEPWRMAVSYLYKIFGLDFMNMNLPFLNHINPSSIAMLCNAVDKRINSPLTSSAGRLFDAVAALINLCPVSKFHAEAPMRLEAAIDKKIQAYYSFKIGHTISFDETFISIVNDLKNAVAISEISAKFHNTIILITCEAVKKIRDEHHLNKVVLSGGTFQNKYLLENLENKLAKEGFEVFTHCKVPTNDGAIALGQLVVGAKKTSQKQTN